ncbi:5-formyltetrahydrofolate cyclo-ligase [Blastococcus goldschmidtiae]|uniref:5-formyltetrahydrofolate cyclo-ligase n=1 Tax=Blastococcus goldschmidtiae TaxID=3075546 RepID=A0ABU2K6B2_9ACTN|nr:5-formyltetrahydrofolate cyclo-ligase [Blastococcus sp. DSM 46792]MDT0275740.1 5-formyltetrahydrofolate cyclo-ligase [Blastococcus sp. DSM 46792]
MTPGRDAVAAKSALREQHLSARRARPAADRAAAAAAVATVLLEELAGVRTVAAYVPEETEPGYGRLPAVLGRLGARVLLPVVAPHGRELAWAVDSGRLAPGRFGLLEPVGPRLGAAAVGTAEVVVVPALAASRDGVRLGRGGGYYDRALLLTQPGALLVAVVYDDEFVDALPAEPHDQRVGAVVTPSGGWQALSAGR